MHRCLEARVWRVLHDCNQRHSLNSTREKTMKHTKFAMFATAVSLTLFAASAMAQSGPTLEIDFTSIVVPLSPALSALIAIALAGLGAYALRRTRGNGRAASWILFVLAALPLAAQVGHVTLVSEAKALPVANFPMASSPTFEPVSFGTYNAINQTGTTITLTVIQVNNGAGVLIYAPNTTCAVGMALPPGASCAVFVAPDA
ncbi:MAG: midcut-by-XrtH protein [Casimicrobiaceae bacterium]